VELGLAGRVAIVTGASKGIGLAVTEVLVDEGVAVVAGARRSSPELTRLARTGRVLPPWRRSPGASGARGIVVATSFTACLTVPRGIRGVAIATRRRLASGTIGLSRRFI